MSHSNSLADNTVSWLASYIVEMLSEFMFIDDMRKLMYS